MGGVRTMRAAFAANAPHHPFTDQQDGGKIGIVKVAVSVNVSVCRL